MPLFAVSVEPAESLRRLRSAAMEVRLAEILWQEQQTGDFHEPLACLIGKVLDSHYL